MSISTGQDLIEKIQAKQARIGIIGLGYVGLPLAIEFAEAGYNVLGIDKDVNKIKMLNEGNSYIADIDSDVVSTLVEQDRLQVTVDFEQISDLDAISICVPTPLRKTRDPDMSYVVDAAEEISEHLKTTTLIILESTTYPGTTAEVVLPIMLRNGHSVGEDIFLAYSPERIDPANKIYGVRNTPKVIGGITKECVNVAKALYGNVVDSIVKVSSTQAAEMVKLLENTFRAVNIGLINEITIMCDKLGIDVWEVIDAAETKPFGYMPFYPGPGLGGHCIPIDPLYLSWKLKSLNFNARFIELADEINTNMPRYVVRKVAESLNEDSKPVRNSNVLVLGVAYKPNVDDIRESPALDIIELLKQQGAHVVYHDPHVPEIQFEKFDMTAVNYDSVVLESVDCVIIVTDHSYYDWSDVLDHAKLVVDTRNATNGLEGMARIVKI
ncbi:MAG TPA: UDP-N-acetyl-D-glucosamine dehydrogenase [Chloroflexi bacterium]|nr:UDP-N-acetyl-D-glucosamine dehydrogenase [Chloroflexota bacterium]|tara:strand:- start:13790 stop:15106 length:1317 start_codon:yes stop_codon:yes gene_type:complete